MMRPTSSERRDGAVDASTDETRSGEIVLQLGDDENDDDKSQSNVKFDNNDNNDNNDNDSYNKNDNEIDSNSDDDDVLMRRNAFASNRTFIIRFVRSLLLTLVLMIII